ncbi:MAG: hypothetical protein AAGC95_17740 [Pseudomonadota bacterium]
MLLLSAPLRIVAHMGAEPHSVGYKPTQHAAHDHSDHHHHHDEAAALLEILHGHSHHQGDHDHATAFFIAAHVAKDQVTKPLAENGPAVTYAGRTLSAPNPPPRV